MSDNAELLPQRIWVPKQAFYHPEPPSYADEKDGIWYTRADSGDSVGLNLFRQLVSGKNALRDLGVFACNDGEHDAGCVCFWGQCERWAEADALIPVSTAPLDPKRGCSRHDGMSAGCHECFETYKNTPDPRCAPASPLTSSEPSYTDVGTRSSHVSEGALTAAQSPITVPASKCETCGLVEHDPDCPHNPIYDLMDHPVELLPLAREEATRALSTTTAAQPFQDRIKPWLLACFGEQIAADKVERNHRFLEEALELVQACGCTESEAHQLVDYTYNRPSGYPSQEVGGVMVTLAALCLANGLDMHEAGETELARIWTKVDVIRAKQAAKPKHSPLPEHAPSISEQAQRAGKLIAHELNGGDRADCSYPVELIALLDDPSIDNEAALAKWVAAIIEAELAHKGEDAIATLRERFIRPEHELTPEFQKAKSMAGTRAKPWRCSKCGEYAVVNNVCGNCERDERLRYGDFERTMTTYEWTIIQANLGDSIK